MSRRLAVTENGTVEYIGRIVATDTDGLNHEITRALVVKADGRCHQFWPIDGAEPNAIQWPTDEITVRKVDTAPANAVATISFDRATGVYTYDNDPSAPISGPFLQPPLTGPAGSTLLTGMVSWHSLNEASGTRADSHGSNDLTEVGTVGSVAGHVGNAASFSAGNFLHAAAANPAYTPNDFSWCGWVNMNDTNPGVIASVANSNDRNSWSIEYQSGFFIGVSSNGSSFRALSTATGAGTGTWVLVYAEFVNGKMGISVNNEALIQDTLTITMNGAQVPYALGAHYFDGFGALPLNGAVDEAGFWNRGLTQAERDEIWAGGAGIAYPVSAPPYPDDDKYLIRLDVVSGVIGGDATATWIDLNDAATVAWNVTRAAAGVDTAESDIHIAPSLGGGVPDTGSQVTRRVNFHAEVEDQTLTWNTNPWAIEEITFGIDADCKLRFEANGTAFGEGDTSGTFSENWSSNPAGTETVQVNLVSGDAPAGPALGAPHVLDQQRLWTLAATTGEDKSCELDVIVDDTVTTVTKRVTMHSRRDDAVNELVWTAVANEIGDFVLSPGTAQATFQHRARGDATGIGQNDGENAGWPETWHTDSPAAANPEAYEWRVRLVSGTGPNVTGSATLNTWYNCDTDRFAALQRLTAGTVTGVWDIDYRKVGEAATMITKRITLLVDVGDAS